jgi:predicted GNAT family acetyltransferase
MQQLNIFNNGQRQQFQTEIDGQLASLEYRLHEGRIVLMHTEVPPALGGRGIGSALVEYALNYARTHHLPVKIYCPFVAAYVRRHSEQQDIVVESD